MTWEQLKQAMRKKHEKQIEEMAEELLYTQNDVNRLRTTLKEIGAICNDPALDDTEKVKQIAQAILLTLNLSPDA